jgi:hypothetical protein
MSDPRESLYDRLSKAIEDGEISDEEAREYYRQNQSEESEEYDEKQDPTQR